jgi:transcription initiation factor TFIID subunit 6
MMTLTESLLKNKHLFMDPYLHQLLPSILTCIVAKRMGEDTEDHITVRRYASVILKFLVDGWGTAYAGMQSRITKTLLRPLGGLVSGDLSHYWSIYGALVGLMKMGREVVKLLVVPVLEKSKRELVHGELKTLMDACFDMVQE